MEKSQSKEDSLSDKLEDILYKYAEFPDEFDRHRCNKAILDLFKSLVPEVVGEEELSTLSVHDYEDGEISGWNACREEMLKRLT